MNETELELYYSAEKNINIMRCPQCLGCQIGIGCKTKTDIVNKKTKFKTSLACVCGFGLWNDDWYDSFEEALTDLHSQRIDESIKTNGYIKYDSHGNIVD